MGFLLLQYEYQRANNQYNLCERTGIRLNNLVDKYTKRVGKMEEMFQKAESTLQNNWNNKANLIQSEIQNASVIGATGGASAVNAVNAFSGALSGIVIGGTPLTSIVNVGSLLTISGSTSDPASISAAISAAAGKVRAIVSTYVEALKQYELDRLNEQRDQQLQPIQDAEDEYTAQKNTNETLTTVWEQRRDAAKERLGKDIENGVARYGIGR